MARDERSSEWDDELLRAFEETVLHDYPNPDRIGCPGSAVLKDLALKRLPLRHPARQHIARCSPCFRELKRYQQACGRKRLMVTGVGLAAIALVGISGFWYVFHFSPSVLHRRGDQSSIDAVDLWDQPGTRGETGPIGAQKRPIQLRRGKLTLRVRLPFGSPAGPYELEIGKTEDQPLRQAIGEAAIENGVTFLRASVDTSGFDPGDYFLGVRRPNRTWRHYHIEIR